MPLPDLIEIVPLHRAVQSLVSVPGSKSITNRALILGALAPGRTRLRHALWSEDTQIMVEALRRLGFELNIEPETDEPCNRTVVVQGQGGRIPRAGTPAAPLSLFVGNAGTAARFLAALVCLGQGSYRLEGVARMRERPQAGLFDALRQLGYRVDATGNKLPATIHGTGPRAGHCQVRVEESSQFASALLLGQKAGGWEVDVQGENAEESFYVGMTERLIRLFAQPQPEFSIEPDASSGSYFFGADWLLRQGPLTRGSRVRVRGWPKRGLQIDARFPEVFPLPAQISRERDLGDSILTAMVLSPFATAPVRFTELRRLRLQECDRVAAIHTELARCGIRVEEGQDWLVIHPGPLQGAEIETYQDHRIAMAFALLGLRVPGIQLKNPTCVKKTFPNFFQKFAADPPCGLGARVLSAGSKEALQSGELFAE